MNSNPRLCFCLGKKLEFVLKKLNASFASGCLEIISCLEPRSSLCILYREQAYTQVIDSLVWVYVENGIFGFFKGFCVTSIHKKTDSKLNPF